MNTELKPIAVIYPRTFAVEFHRVLYTPFDEVSLAVEKLQRDHRTWVRPEEVDRVLSLVNPQKTV